LSDQIEIDRDERGFAPQPSCGRRSFAAGVSSTYNDHIKGFVKHIDKLKQRVFPLSQRNLDCILTAAVCQRRISATSGHEGR
jgi:hypothetical protein